MYVILRIINTFEEEKKKVYVYYEYINHNDNFGLQKIQLSQFVVGKSNRCSSEQLFFFKNTHICTHHVIV